MLPQLFVGVQYNPAGAVATSASVGHSLFIDDIDREIYGADINTDININIDMIEIYRYRYRYR